MRPPLSCCFTQGISECSVSEEEEGGGSEASGAADGEGGSEECEPADEAANDVSEEGLAQREARTSGATPSTAAAANGSASAVDKVFDAMWRLVCR